MPHRLSNWFKEWFNPYKRNQQQSLRAHHRHGAGYGNRHRAYLAQPPLSAQQPALFPYHHHRQRHQRLAHARQLRLRRHARRTHHGNAAGQRERQLATRRHRSRDKRHHRRGDCVDCRHAHPHQIHAHMAIFALRQSRHLRPPILADYHTQSPIARNPNRPLAGTAQPQRTAG